MGRPRKQGPCPGQLSMLDLLDELSLARAIHDRVKKALAEDLEASAYPRDQVAARMSGILDQAVTRVQLDAWTAATKPLHRFPLEYLPAFVLASGQFRTLSLLVRSCGGRLVMPDQVRRELGQVEEERRRLAGRERTLRSVVEAVDAGVLG